MPATLLISVDLPAPLSPTSAITSPARTSKSASRSAWTDPKLLEIPRSSRVGGSGVITAPFSITVEALRRAPLPLQVLLAVLLVLADADLALLQEAFLEEERVVLLRDPDGRQQDRLRALELRDLARHLPVLDERDRDVRGRLCLEADRLVDGAGLPAREDELDAGRRGVLTRKRDGLQAVRLQRRHHRAGKTVVRREDAVDLVAVAGEHLVEDLPSLDRIPIRPLVAGGRLFGRRAGARRRCGGDQPDEDGRGEGRDRPAGKFLHVSSFDDETRWYVRTTPVVTPTSETWETRLC